MPVFPPCGRPWLQRGNGSTKAEGMSSYCGGQKMAPHVNNSYC